MDTLTLLQHYWWLIISLLGALLVFLLFVQGGQAMLYDLGRTDEERNMIVNALGRKWEFTFTTLVTFGGAFFASFPLFYSTSFGGAAYVWTAILLCFVIQAVAYEYRRKPANVFGERTYNAFLLINGLLGPLLLGMAVSTLFTGANFTVDRLNLAGTGGEAVISQWTTPWHGLEAVADIRNWLLGLAVTLLAQLLACQYPRRAQSGSRSTNTCTTSPRCPMSPPRCWPVSCSCSGASTQAGGATGGPSGSAVRGRSSRCWPCCSPPAGTIRPTTLRWRTCSRR